MEEMKQKKSPDQEVLETLISKKKELKERGTAIRKGGMIGGMWGGPLAVLIENAEFLANFVESYKRRFLEAFFDSFLRKMREKWREKGDKGGCKDE